MDVVVAGGSVLSVVTARGITLRGSYNSILLVYQYVFSLQLFLAYGFDRLIEIIYRSNHGRRGCEKR